MERREFLKISAVSGATAALDACGKPERQLIRFIPEEDLIPGIAVWKPNICTLCSAGCGMTVRVMEGDAEVVRHGETGLIKMGLAKKLEGNPKHPISQGKLCARGQAGLQVTYHPDRIRHPLKRSGPRGSGQFMEISWDEGVKELVSQLSKLKSAGQSDALTFIARPGRSQRQVLIHAFTKAYGAPPPVFFEFFENDVLREANALSFNRRQLPTFDLANSNYVLSFGADLLGTWNSPVAQSAAYGRMRQGRPGNRGKFVQMEARMCQTGANADQWINVRPGNEGLVALSIAHVILNEKLRPVEYSGNAGSLIPGWGSGLDDFAPEKTEARAGVASEVVKKLAREMAAHPPAVAIIGGAPLAQTNGLFNAVAVNALNSLLGSVGKPGGVVFTEQLPPAQELPQTSSTSGHAALLKLIDSLQSAKSQTSLPVQALLLDGANPAYAFAGFGAAEAIAKIPFIASFGSFVDETSVLADLILPDHSPLESWLDTVAESGATEAVTGLAPPAMLPLHNTRSMPDVLLDAAHKLGAPVAQPLPWKNYEEMLRSAYVPLRKVSGSITSSDDDDFWKTMQQEGGWWSAAFKEKPSPRPTSARPANITDTEAKFGGDGGEFPFHFLPFESQQFLDGSLANLPWLEEMPDVLSTSMWGTWLEINPQTAKRLGIGQGDLLEVASQHGKLQAPALISPGIAPDVVAMPAGQGHTNFTRYASGRGANPFSILAPLKESVTGSLAWAATRVKVTKVGKGKLILFAGGLREQPEEFRHR